MQRATTFRQDHPDHLFCCKGKRGQQPQSVEDDPSGIRGRIEHDSRGEPHS